MDLKSKYIDKLITLREEARNERNWSLSDDIRDYLDTKSVFVFDTPNGQIVYHKKESTRSDLIKEIKVEQRAQKLFDAWLFSMNSIINRKTSQQ